MNPTVSGAARSKTVWLGLVITLMGYMQANLPLAKTILSPYMRPELVDVAMAVATMGLGMGVIVVRFFTENPLSKK